jgi:hypothetical protein
MVMDGTTGAVRRPQRLEADAADAEASDVTRKKRRQNYLTKTPSHDRHNDVHHGSHTVTNLSAYLRVGYYFFLIIILLHALSSCCLL